MPEFTQENRRLRITTPLGADAVLVTDLSGHEGISSLFGFELQLLGQEPTLDFEQIVGKPVTIEILMTEDAKRYVHGIVSRFSQSGTVGDHGTYSAQVVPWTWFLTRTTDCRIFQHLSVPDIVKKIFSDQGFTDFELRLGSYEPREYCVQYRETDYNFIARLMEEEGIYFFFKHEDGKHTMMLADDSTSADPCPELSSVRFMHESGSGHEDDVVTWFRKEQEVRASRYTLIDYNFEQPHMDLVGHAKGKDSRKYEIYDYPGGPGELVTSGDLERIVRVRQQEEDTGRVALAGGGYCRSFTPGYRFEMSAEGEDVLSTFDGKYLLTSVRHHASETYGQDDGAGLSYSNDFECIEASVPYRPLRRTPRPVINGVQTAVVVGPSGEEIFVDKYGRVKVQFFWDREGKKNESSSCYVRVSQPWAGKNWGTVAIPRIGQEVIVSFLEGDPDAPIITGRVYNADQMPPYDLPANKTQSGMKSRSSLNGSPANFNEIRMEDKKGSEELYFHAEKNQTIVVENDKSESIGHDESITVGHDKTEKVDNNETITIAVDRQETVGSNETLAVGSNRTRTVGKNETVTVALTRTHTVGVNEAISVGAAQEITVGAMRALTVGASQTTTIGINHTEQVGKDHKSTVGKDQTLEVGGERKTKVGKNDDLNVGKKWNAEAADEIVFTTGQSSITMKKDGTIVIKGKAITLDAMQKIEHKAMNITSEAQTKNITKGAMVNVEASGINTVKGSLVKIN